MEAEQPVALKIVEDALHQFVSYLPTLLAGLLVLVLGLFVAWVASRVLSRMLILLRLHRVLARLGWAHALEKGDVRHSLFRLVGTVVGGLIFLVFLDNALLIWRLTVLSQLLGKLVLLIPRLMTATIVLLSGWGIAGAVSRAVRRALYQEEFEKARLVGRIIYAAIVFLTIAIALVQLEIAVAIVTGACLIAFGALALSFVLAFGLGSRRAVELMWEARFRNSKADEGAKTDRDRSEG